MKGKELVDDVKSDLFTDLFTDFSIIVLQSQGRGELPRTTVSLIFDQ